MIYPAPRPPLTIHELTSLCNLEAIFTEWKDLFERCHSSTPFQRPEWIVSWSRHFECRTIWTLAVRCRGRLVALAPWLVYEKEGQHTVAFLAGGVSDYHDILVDAEFIGPATAELYAHLIRRRAAWDECDFEQLGPRSIFRATDAPACFVERRAEQEICTGLSLPAAPAALSAAVPSHQLARFRKYRRRAERQGTLAMELASADERPHALDELFALHAARRANEGHCEEALSDQARAFHHDVANAMAAPVHAQVYRLRFAGTTMAALYGFRQADVFHCYMQGFDPAFSDMSPGILLVGSLLEHLQKTAVTTVDFLRGSEPYKLAWGAAGSPNLRRTLRPKD